MEQPRNYIVFKTPYGYKLLMGWSGGYLGSDSWQVNSGIVSCTEDENFYIFKGISGSVYRCRKNSYGVKMNTQAVFNKLKDEVEFLDDQYWAGFEWKIN